MVDVGGIFWMKNPFEEPIKHIAHMYLTVQNNESSKKVIIGTSKLVYIISNNLEYKEANCSPVSKLTYFITNRLFILEDIRIKEGAIARPGRLTDNAVEKEILDSVKEDYLIPICKNELIKLNPTIDYV